MGADGHGLSKAAGALGAGGGFPKSFAGLMVPGGSGRHQWSIPSCTDSSPRQQGDTGHARMSEPCAARLPQPHFWLPNPRVAGRKVKRQSLGVKLGVPGTAKPASFNKRLNLLGGKVSRIPSSSNHGP